MKPTLMALGAGLAAALLALVALVTVSPDNWHTQTVQAQAAGTGR